MLVFDEDAGLVYEGYNRDLAELMCILKWYTDVELGAYATEEGRYLLSDIMESHGTMTQIREIAGEDLAKVQGIYADLKTAARRTFEQKHGLSHLIRSTLGAILGGEDITKTVAHAQDINASLIDMLGALNREKAGGEGKLLNFARRDLTT